MAPCVYYYYFYCCRSCPSIIRFTLCHSENCVAMRFGVDIAINVKLHVNHSWSSSPLISLQPFPVDGLFGTLVHTPFQQVCSNAFCSRTQFQFNGNNIVSFVSAWKIVYAHATEEIRRMAGHRLIQSVECYFHKISNPTNRNDLITLIN